ncbi:TonB-dependent receptor [Mongoliibacter ruber]|uniref:Iron complex outermembrane receptor protein n=1 Tax=Mongoliibacter ruber TaxID=1750599 RepID=A0A2T0WT51_9BACT|nr:TonB-dependent receptor [Mongoliibacter ruber]PRY89858.1 iron complex outermembrane receptor protein [Mongoliibacter ruber]
MILRIIGVLLLLGVTNFTVAQQEIHVLVLDEHSEQPIPGATVQMLRTQIGAVTDQDGVAVLNRIPSGNITLRISLIGFEKKELNLKEEDILISPYQVAVYLHEAHGDLEEVVISSTRSSRTIADIPTRVEFIAGEELDEKVNMKPGDIRVLLSESTGIMVQTTSATSANASIRIQGLDGRYTQLLRDGFPLYSGAASGLSLLQIPPLDLQQVEVIKGSSSTLYGGGAIAGLVNLISKRPTQEGELSFLLNGTNAGGFDASTFYGKRNDKWGTTLFAAFNTNQPYDPAGIGLSAIPKFNRFTFNPRLFVYPTSQTEIDFGLNFNYEDRKGGNMVLLRNESSASNLFFENNESGRISSQFSLSHSVGEHKKWVVKNAVNYFERTLTTNAFTFDGAQLSSFTELNHQINHDQMDWVLGANLWTERFEEINSSSDRDYNLTTVGVFAQNTWSLNPSWILESGLRSDYVVEYGWAVLPRLALLWKQSERFSSRLGGGLGYKAPTIFTEESERLQYRNIQGIDPDRNVLEKSYGVNWDFNFRQSLFDDKLFVSINHMFFYTYLDRPLFLEPLAVSSFRFVNIEGYSDTKGVETNVKWEWKDFKWFMGYTYTHARIVEENQVRENPLTPRHRINSVLFYEVHNKWKVGWESYYFSAQQLSDGSVGKSYWIMGFMAEKIWEHVSVYINFENFLDARQTRFDSIFTGRLDQPNFREIYAPLDGFVINGGVKIRI